MYILRERKDVLASRSELLRVPPFGLPGPSSYLVDALRTVLRTTAYRCCEPSIALASSIQCVTK
jgi:hypothetical protein